MIDFLICSVQVSCGTDIPKILERPTIGYVVNNLTGDESYIPLCVSLQ